MKGSGKWGVIKHIIYHVNANLTQQIMMFVFTLILFYISHYSQIALWIILIIFYGYGTIMVL